MSKDTEEFDINNSNNNNSDDEDNAWRSNRKLILHRLNQLYNITTDLNSKVSTIKTDDIPALKVEIAKLKIKAGVWGGLAGMIPVLLALLFYILQRLK